MNENQNPDEIEQLRQQNAELQKQLELTRVQRDEFKEAAYSFFEKLHPYVPPTEAELHEMLHGPRGKSLHEVIEEAEKEYYGEAGAPNPNG